MDREAWCAAIHGVAKSQTWLSDLTELNWNIYLLLPERPSLCISRAINLPKCQGMWYAQRPLSLGIANVLCDSACTEPPPAGEVSVKFHPELGEVWPWRPWKPFRTKYTLPWHNWETSLSLFTFMHWRRKWQPTPVFLPGESQGQGILVGCRLRGCTESDTTEVT